MLNQSNQGNNMLTVKSQEIYVKNEHLI